MITNKLILDACCGGKSFWFQKQHPDVLYIDRKVCSTKKVGKGKNARNFECQPDMVIDFRSMPFAAQSFKMVVFDPPHLTTLGSSSYMAQKYGKLDKDTWREDLRQGFYECFRVLQNHGVLIFKWNEHDIRLSEVLKLTDNKPLFGHPSGKAQKTHWVCFMKGLQS